MRAVTVIMISIVVGVWILVPWPFGQKHSTKPPASILSDSQRITALESSVKKLAAELASHKKGTPPTIDMSWMDKEGGAK